MDHRQQHGAFRNAASCRFRVSIIVVLATGLFSAATSQASPSTPSSAAGQSDATASTRSDGSPGVGQKKSAKPPRPSIEGLWDTPGGRIELIRSAAAVKGVLLVPAKGVELKAGSPVVDGTFFEDSFAGKVQVGLVSPDCSGVDATADALLLLTRSGRLVGGLSSSETCLGDLRSASFERVEGRSLVERTRTRMVGPPQDADTYDPRGYRRRAMPGTTAALLEEGAGFLEEGRFERARQLFMQAVEKDPGVGEAYNGVGVTWYARNDLERAIEWYKRGLEASPGFGDLYYNLACAYALLGRTNMALRYLRLAALRGYAEADMVDEDPDLDSLRAEPEFAAIRQLFDGGGSPSPAQPSPGQSAGSLAR